MRRTTQFGIGVLCVSLSIACGGRSDAEQDDPNDDIDIEKTSTVTETGCLTGKGDRFVLTALERDTVETEMYQLVGDNAELRKYLGREVRVTGDAEPARVAELRESASSTTTGTAGSSERPQAKVTTEAETRLETRQLRVATVAPTGNSCPTGTPQ